ncbi:putative cAMP specific phosphodiesterase, partial [Leptomonas pyrrhocoris]
MYYSPPNGYSLAQRPADGSSHLGEAVALCQSILARYRRTGCTFSSSELKALKVLRDACPDAAHDAAGGTAAQQNVSDDFLRDLDQAGSVLQFDEEVMSFVEKCCDCTMSTKEVFHCLNGHLAAALHAREVHTFVVNSNDHLLFDPVNGVASPLDDSTPIGKTSQSHETFVISNVLYIPIWARTEFVGAVEVPGGAASQCATSVFARLLRGVTVALKNVKALLVKELAAQEAEAMVGMATRLARDTLDEAVLVQSIINTAKTLTESDRCSIFLVKGNGTLEAHFEDGKVVVMAAGTGIAGYVAKTGMVVNIP